MALSLVTAPATEPITLAEAKAHCRVDTDDENGLISTLIVAAREYAETFTHRPFITQIWDDKRDDFPCDEGAIELPLPPLQITPTAPVVTYIDSNGATQTWSASLYTVDAPSGPKALPGRIVPVYGQYFPVTRDVMNAVTIRFVAGYSTAAAVPAGIKAAMRLLIGHWWLHRESVNIGNITTELPQGAHALLWPFKVC